MVHFFSLIILLISCRNSGFILMLTRPDLVTFFMEIVYPQLRCLSSLTCQTEGYMLSHRDKRGRDSVRAFPLLSESLEGLRIFAVLVFFHLSYICHGSLQRLRCNGYSQGSRDIWGMRESYLLNLFLV